MSDTFFSPRSTGNQTIAIGNTVSTSVANSVLLGYTGNSLGSGAVGIGHNINPSGTDTVCIGRGATTIATDGVAVGNAAVASGEAVSIGSDSSSTSVGVAIGQQATEAFGGVALGYKAITTGSSQLVCGSVSAGVSEIYFGAGVTAAAPSSANIYPTGGSGTNITAGDLTINGGLSTGNATPGKVFIRTSTAGATGVTLQTASNRITVDTSVTRFHHGMRFNRTATAVSYQILVTDFYIGVTSTAAARTITVPAVGLLNSGMTFVIKDESGGAATNNITVAGGGVNIDGAANYVINTNYGSVTIVSDQANFFVI